MFGKMKTVQKLSHAWAPVIYRVVLGDVMTLKNVFRVAGWDIVDANRIIIV